MVKLIALLPFPILYLLSDIHYLLVYHLVGYRKKVVRENLLYSFPDKSTEEQRKIERQFYRHLTDLVFESLKLMGMREKDINSRMVYIDYEQIIKHFDEGRSVMALTSHYCNWEWTSSLSLFLPKDKPAYQIYKKQKSASVNRLIDSIRCQFGAQNIEMKNLLREMVRMRNDEKIGVFGMLSDQSPGRSSIHYHTEFLNQDTAVITGTEQIAKKFDYPVYYARMKKLKRGYYSCQFIPLSTAPKTIEGYGISEQYMRLLEEDIQANPAYWLWSHKRWKITRNHS